MTVTEKKVPPVIPAPVVKIDARDDAAITCQCGTMVSPLFKNAGINAVCPRCGETV